MFAVEPSIPPPSSRVREVASRKLQVFFLLVLWVAIYGCSLTSPALLDDADATHAQAAQAMLRTGDWVTLHVNGIRYLEKAPLPYWISALSLRLFGNNAFAVHLPLALTVLGLAALAWIWADKAFPAPHGLIGFYAAVFTLTAAGVFLFTRIFIPDALLSLLLGYVLYAALRALDAGAISWALTAWIALALAVLTKGLVAIVLIFGALALYLALTGDRRYWRRLHPLIGSCIFLAIAAPWHILAGLRNRGGANGHGFFWFYFVNEHLLRFLGRRIPADYNKLPALLYWSLHLIWLFPWSFFLPATAVVLWRDRASLRRTQNASFAQRSTLLAVLFAALVLIFFSLSTNQEYYTFPVYVPVLLLTASALARLEALTPNQACNARNRRILIGSHLALLIFCMLASAAIAFGLWSSRALPAAPDIGNLLDHRGVAGYTLSMSHVFDLTTAAFSALRFPASIALAALATLPALSLFLRLRQQHTAATLTVAMMSSTFLMAAHLALVRFAPLLSSADFARIIQRETASEPGSPPEILIFGDQAFGSSIPFYLGHPVNLVDGRSTSMLFGSTFPDAPRLFLTPAQLSADWGHGPRKLLVVPVDRRSDADVLLGSKAILVYANAGKALYTDRPLTPNLAAAVGQQLPRPEQ